MKISWLHIAAILLASAGPALPQGGTGGTSEDSGLAVQRNLDAKSVEVNTNSAVVLQSAEPFAELSIANPEIADISTISTTSLYILGKQPGRTTLVLIGGDGRVLNIVDIRVTPDISELLGRLADILPGEDISVYIANDGLVMTGTVSSQDAVSRAGEVANHYAPGRVSNLLAVRPPEAESADLDALREDLALLLPEEEISADLSEGRIVLSGTVSSPDALAKALSIAARHAPDEPVSELSVREPAPMELPTAAELEARLLEILPDEAIRVHEVGGAYVLSGEVSSAERVNQALEVARLAAGGGNVTNMMVVQERTPCVVRTRRGDQVIDTTIPCR